MEQRSEEWFKARKGRITASAIGAILGVNPWRTREDVMQEMLGNKPPFQGNMATDYGTSHEDIAKRELKIMHGINVVDCGFYVHPLYDWLGASPDGLVGGDELVEIKCPFGIRDDEKPEFKSLSDQPHYYAQLQLQMACTGRNDAYFYQWTRNGDRLESVSFNPMWWAKNFPILEKFWAELQARRNEDTTSLESMYHEAKRNFDAAKIAFDDARAALIDAANGTPRKFGDISVIEVNRKGGIDYKKAFSDLLPDADLSVYKKPDSKYWTVK